MQLYEQYTLPEYYKNFVCKCGDCRNSCCGGWDISLTMTEYYRLIGLDCSPELHRKLECAFYRPDYPTPDRFALVNRRFDGKCPLQRDDGLCSVQKECGYDVLTSICKRYPRSIKSTVPFECCCSGSCEAVIELLMKIHKTLQFEKSGMTCGISEDGLPEGQTGSKEDAGGHETLYPNPEIADNIVGSKTAIRFTAIKIIQEKSLPIEDRFELLRIFSSEIDNMRAELTTSGLDMLVASYAPEKLSGKIKNILCKADHFGDKATNNRILQDTSKLLLMFEKRSQSIELFGSTAIKALGIHINEASDPIISDDVMDKYTHACQLIHQVLPHADIVYEHIIANNMFYRQFPFGDTSEFDARHDPYLFENKARALSILYYMLKFITAGGVANVREDPSNSEPFLNAFTDSAAGLFRMAEHSEFTHNCLVYVTHEGLFGYSGYSKEIQHRIPSAPDGNNKDRLSLFASE